VANGESCTYEDNKLKTSTKEIECNYANQFLGFDVNHENVSTYYSVDDDTVLITPEFEEYGEEYKRLKIFLEYKKDTDYVEGLPILGVAGLTWSLRDEEGNVYSLDDDGIGVSKITETELAITISKDYNLEDKYILCATQNEKDTEYELCVQKLVGGTVTLNGQVLNAEGVEDTNNITLVTTEDRVEFDVAECAYTITNDFEGVRLFKHDITLTCTGDGLSVENTKSDSYSTISVCIYLFVSKRSAMISASYANISFI
jgi:hypothetical protein